jgi:iron complex outermembrane receptor protein
VFGEVTLSFTERLKLIGGARYTHEDRFGRQTPNMPSIVKPPLATFQVLGDDSFNSVTPRVSALYKVTDNTNLYATYSQGFKSGLFQANVVGAPPIRPEKVKSYEIGAKSSGAGWTANIAAFYYDYTDFHVSVFIPGTTIFQNAPSARIRGVEFETVWRATPALTLSANGAYIDAKYRRFPNALAYIPLAAGGNVGVTVNVADGRMLRAPKFTGNLSATYTVDTSMGEVELSGNAYYSSKLSHDFIFRLVQPGHVVANARLALRPREDLELAVYGRNLGNEKVISSTIISTFGDSVGFQLPRTYGVEAIVNF